MDAKQTKEAVPRLEAFTDEKPALRVFNRKRPGEYPETD